MATTFEDIQVIGLSERFAGSVPGPQTELTPEQVEKVDQLKSLIVEVGDVTFDTEIDILIVKMTEILDRE